MSFQVQLLLITFAVSVISALVIIPILAKLKVGQNERNDGPQSHLKKQGTTTMGGLIMIVGMIIVTIFGYKKMGVYAPKVLALLLISIGFGLVGFVDDFKKLVLRNTEGLKPKYKMLGLLIISIAFVIYLLKCANLGTDTMIPIAKVFINIPVWIYIPAAIFIILGTTNAINLTDGIDGLSATVSTIIITCLTVIAIIYGIPEVAIFGSIAAGATVGFLLFNLHPAKIFMGDTGSILLGGVIASMALYLKMPLLLIIIALVPVCETLSVMIQVSHYKRTGKRVFKMAPLHHHFELCGWNENKIVSIFSVITLFLCVLGLYMI